MPPISPFISVRCKNCTQRRSIQNPATKIDRNCSLISTTFNKSSSIIYTWLTPSGLKQKISRKPELQIPPLPTYLPGECKSTMPICWIYKTLPLREWPYNQSLQRKPRRYACCFSCYCKHFYIYCAMHIIFVRVGICAFFFFSAYFDLLHANLPTLTLLSLKAFSERFIFFKEKFRQLFVTRVMIVDLLNFFSQILESKVVE